MRHTQADGRVRVCARECTLKSAKCTRNGNTWSCARGQHALTLVRNALQNLAMHKTCWRHLFAGRCQGAKWLLINGENVLVHLRRSQFFWGSDELARAHLAASYRWRPSSLRHDVVLTYMTWIRGPGAVSFRHSCGRHGSAMYMPLYWQGSPSDWLVP